VCVCSCVLVVGVHALTVSIGHPITVPTIGVERLRDCIVTFPAKPCDCQVGVVVSRPGVWLACVSASVLCDVWCAGLVRTL
jgi:hypothetical protein